MPGRRRRPERRLLEISVLKQSPCEKRSLQGAVREVEAAGFLFCFFKKKGCFLALKKNKKPASSINDFVHWPLIPLQGCEEEKKTPPAL